ncbi:IS30 family transposase, partial [Corynebacterium tuscaniense]
MSGSRWDPSGDEVVRFHRLVVVEGLSVRAAGLRLGWSLSTAYRIAHRDSLPLRARSPLTQADRDAIAGLFAQGLMPMDIARAVGLDPSAVYRVGVAVGAWRKPSGNRRAVATTRRVEYLKLRVCGMDRNSAADACGMSRRTALDVDKGVVKGSHRRVVFVPDG